MTESIQKSQPLPPERNQGSKQVPLKDLEEYIQLKEEIKQIEVLLTMAQNLVQDHLNKTKNKTQDSQFHVEKVPVTGNSQERENITTFNALQPLIAIELESLKKQILILNKDDIHYSERDNSALNQLEEVANAFPKISEDQIDVLDRLFDTLQFQANQTDEKARGAFWTEVRMMYRKMAHINEENSKEIEKNLQKLRKTQAPGEEIEGAERAQVGLESTHKNLEKAAEGATLHATLSGALPKQFQDAILKHYMPQQEKYLALLAEALMCDNMGSEFGNQLLNLMTEFNASATNFSLSNSLHSSGKKDENGNTVYNGDATQANAQISKEKNNAYNQVKAINDSLSKIESQIKEVNNDAQLTDTQKNELIKGLKEIETELKTALPQVSALYELLGDLSATTSGDGFIITFQPPETSDSSDWAPALSAYENMVINGATPDEAKKWGFPEGGGLVQISSKTNTFQQTYADQGQNQQMKLQMNMTQIQQEWTVVSTALQLLNQMYMTIAQGIYK
ncbi:MAG: CT620/CT621 family type III secretion system effector [Chlamydiales bacterium]